jgi:hypothetical protein
MQKENIHIVFGWTRRTLIDSQLIDMNVSQIISLKDILNIGPPCDIHENKNIQNREDWLQKVFDSRWDPVEQDLKKIEAIVESAVNIDNIYIWAGFNPSEMISTARLIHHLSKLDKPIFITNYPNIPVKSIRGDIIYPKSLAVTAAFQIKDVLEHFRLIDNDGLSDWINLWDKVKSENGQLWILDKKGQLSVEETTYFDSFLISNCNESFQCAARVIGETLVDIDFNLGDGYLNSRLKQLVLEEKIEARGKLLEMRDYEVRKNAINKMT